MTRFDGVLVPVLTPVDAALNPDLGRWLYLCRTLLAEGAAGLAVFGTTSEANSLSAPQRMAALERLIAAGVPASRLLPGTGANAVAEAADLLRHARACGCGGVLMLPPFYYKSVTDEGLFAFFAAAFERAGDPPPVYLYHIPPVAGVGFSLDLVERLAAAFPQVVVGLKDSSGDWANTAALFARLPHLRVFPGSERFLLAGLRAGAAGCISATANLNLTAMAALHARWRDPEADALQARLTACRRIIERYPVIPALKALIADALNDPDWRRVLPPLCALDPERTADLRRQTAAAGCRLMAGWPATAIA